MSARATGSERARDALARLCQTYWIPLYAFVRRDGYTQEDAEDCVQGFFARFLEADYLKSLDPSAGKFRSYLLAALKHFLSNERVRAAAQKRGGSRRSLPLEIDIQDGERRFLNEPATDVTPERLYERRWALTLLDRVLEDLRSEYEDRGNADAYVVLGAFLPGSRHELSYREAAERLGATLDATKVAIHRLRGRYRDRLREMVAETVSAPEEIEEEVRFLFAALGGS